jgi:hypothetical protein
MSFDVFVARLQFGKPAPVDCARILEVVRAAPRHERRLSGYYAVWLADGSTLEFSAPPLEDADIGAAFSGTAFHLHGFAPGILGFIFNFAMVGDMVIFNAQGSNELGAPSPLVLLTAPEQREHIPDRLGENAVLCESASKLGEFLMGSLKQWRRYRDQVVRGA